jgi:hypothetical protein
LIKYNKQRCISLIENSQENRVIECDKNLANTNQECYSIDRKVKRTTSQLTTQKLSRDSVRENAELDFRVSLKTIHKETKAYLERLARAASEGRAVDEANNYLRWLQFSGIIRLLEQNSSISGDFVTLRNQCNDLQAICLPHLQGRNVAAAPSQARIDELNAKMDIVLAAIAKPISPATGDTATRGFKPTVRVHPAGVFLPQAHATPSVAGG